MPTDPLFIRELSYTEREKIFGRGFNEAVADECFVESILRDDELSESEGMMARLKFHTEGLFNPILKMLGA